MESTLELLVTVMVPEEAWARMSAKGLAPQRIANIIANAMEEDEEQTPQTVDAIKRLRAGEANADIAGRLGYT